MSDPGAALSEALGEAGWQAGDGGVWSFAAPDADWSAWLEGGTLRIDAVQRADGARLEAALACPDDVPALMRGLVPAMTTYGPARARTCFRVLFERGVCASVQIREDGRWMPLADSIALQEQAGRGLVAAVLGAAGWDPEAIPVEGRTDAPARRYVNAQGTLRVAPLDGRRLVLFVPGRLPLFVNTVAAGDRDAAESVLRLIVEWQDGLGAPEGDAAFWSALKAVGGVLLVLRQGKMTPHLDWSRLDEKGAPQAAYLLACPCQRLGGNPESADASLIEVQRRLVHDGWSETFCACRRCGRRWRVEDDPGYHYPTYAWWDVTNDP